MDKVKGYWRVSKWSEAAQKNVIVGAIKNSPDCDGDELYNEMVAKGWIASVDNYECEGDNTCAVLMGKTPTDGDFALDFIFV